VEFSPICFWSHKKYLWHLRIGGSHNNHNNNRHKQAYKMSNKVESLQGKSVNVGFLTSGGLAPCLSSSVASLIQEWTRRLDAGDIAGLTVRLYIGGYKGLLKGESVVMPAEELRTVESLHERGGSPIGNSRVKVRIH
jgi:hypothetical protein